ALFIAGRAHAVHQVGGEAPVEVAQLVHQRDPEVRVRVVGEPRPRDRACALARGAIPEGDERRQVVVESGHWASGGQYCLYLPVHTSFHSTKSSAITVSATLSLVMVTGLRKIVGTFLAPLSTSVS